VTIETEENIVIRGSGNGVAARQMQPLIVRAWCASCQRDVEMITPDEAAAVAGVTARTIYRWVETGKLHFSEAGDASLLICQGSLCVWKSRLE
jgi:excisionase family DNA binding protein